MPKLLKYYGFMHEDIQDMEEGSLIFLDLARYGIKRGYFIDSDNDNSWINDVYYFIERPFRAIVLENGETEIQFDPIPEDKMARIATLRKKIVDKFPNHTIGSELLLFCFFLLQKILTLKIVTKFY